MSRPFQCWAVVDKHGAIFERESERDARDSIKRMDSQFPNDTPHRVVLLREVMKTPKKVRK